MTKHPSIMLIDDNSDDNFFHEREIKKLDPEIAVVVNDSGVKALDYLKLPGHLDVDLILLDINMPGMNGWEFLREYEKFGLEVKNHTILLMLTTSDNEDDRRKTKEFPSVTAYVTKPLTREKVDNIIKTYLK